MGLIKKMLPLLMTSPPGTEKAARLGAIQDKQKREEQEADRQAVA
jgi:hypothetical protein